MHMASKRILRKLVIWFAVFAAAAGVLSYVAFPYLRATALMLQVANPKDHSLITRLGAREVTNHYFEFQSRAGKIHARLFIPAGMTGGPGMVIVHGVHELGIQEPRLMAFAEAMASNGIVVLTPEVESLKDYHVAPDGIAVIGESARWLAGQIEHPVGVMGLSFAGGLALLAASDEHYADSIAFVFAVGAHDDLPRVARFYATDQMLAPGGALIHMQAHEYGPQVLVYAHPEDFFSATDATTAAHAIQLHLYDKDAEAATEAAKLSPASQVRLQSLFKHDLAVIGQPLLDSTAHRTVEMEAVSPHGRLANLHVPVLLLHGAGDNVIPPSETQWLAKEIPAQELKAMLISKALSHVEMEGSISWRDKAQLIGFIANMLKREQNTTTLPPQK